MLKPLFLIGTIASPCWAETISFARPENCEPVITVQLSNCAVATVLRCKQGGELVWRTEESDQDGFSSVWLETDDRKFIGYRPVSDEVAVEGDPDAIPSTRPEEVIASGVGSYNASGQLRLFKDYRRDVEMSGVLRYIGKFKLKSGQELDQIEMTGQIRLPKPAPIIEMKGTAYYHAGSGTYFEGDANFSFPSPNDEEEPYVPVEYYLKNDAGFDDNEPKFGCEQISSLEQSSKLRSA